MTLPIVGMGMGGFDTGRGGGREGRPGADILIGADRLSETCRKTEEAVFRHRAEAVADIVKRFPLKRLRAEERDVGFYIGARKLLEALDAGRPLFRHIVRQYFSTRLNARAGLEARQRHVKK
jgi:precorrin-6Y C5,15-methyltransferase (decarboxylating)